MSVYVGNTLIPTINIGGASTNVPGVIDTLDYEFKTASIVLTPNGEPGMYSWEIITDDPNLSDRLIIGITDPSESTLYVFLMRKSKSESFTQYLTGHTGVSFVISGNKIIFHNALNISKNTVAYFTIG